MYNKVDFVNNYQLIFGRPLCYSEVHMYLTQGQEGLTFYTSTYWEC